ncbi:MAG: PEP-CTERM sorting domain-containing protein, partial [Rivularia sp. (in: cyanobacteria)]
KKKQFSQKSLGRRASKLGQCSHRGVAEKPTLTRQRSAGASLDLPNGGSGDGDVVFTRRTSTSVPEPSGLIGIGAIAFGLMVKKSKICLT